MKEIERDEEEWEAEKHTTDEHKAKSRKHPYKYLFKLKYVWMGIKLVGVERHSKRKCSSSRIDFVSFLRIATSVLPTFSASVLTRWWLCIDVMQTQTFMESVNIKYNFSLSLHSNSSLLYASPRLAFAEIQKPFAYFV